VLGPGLGSLVQTRHAHTRPRPQKGPGDHLGCETSLIQGEAERAGTIESGEEKAQGY